jgi:4-alpha-glucanotransferase
MERTDELAERWGIETGYFDVHGRWREADDEVVRRIADALSGQGVQPAAPDAHALDPQVAFQGDGRRVWVLAVQLYAVRSKRNWGHGDFSDLARLLEIVADCGGAGVGLNPLHALFYDRTTTASPYSPNSRLFLNPLYIDVEAIEEFQHRIAAELASEIERLRALDLLDYPGVARLKLAALRKAHDLFTAGGSVARQREFDAFRQEGGHALQCFAAFETLRALHPGAWQLWPLELREPKPQLLHEVMRTHPAEFGFQQYLQWIADRQFAHCRDIARRRGLAVGLYLDLAVGVDPAGADAWMDQQAFLRGLSIGAPPDQYNPAGQDWGLTAYNPRGLAAANFEPFRQMLRAAMKYAGAIRIDHVLGLGRLYVIPNSVPPADGAYLRVPLDRMLQTVADESRRWRCIAIGEDLGTVPEGFRETLAKWGVWSYLVMMFERDSDGSFRRTRDYPERAIATFNTHDLASFAGWTSGHDLAVKQAIGIDPGETVDDRRASQAALAAALAETCGDVVPRFEDVVSFLAATPARLVSIAIEDVLGIADQVNVPGTVDQHPNWRRRWPIDLEEVAEDRRMRRIATILARAGRGSALAP